MKPRMIEIVSTACYHVLGKCYLTFHLPWSSFSVFVSWVPFRCRTAVLVTSSQVSVPKWKFSSNSPASRRPCLSNSLHFRLSRALLGAWCACLAAAKLKKFSKRLGWPHRMALHRSFRSSSFSPQTPLPGFFSSTKATTPPPTPPLRTLQSFHKH